MKEKFNKFKEKIIKYSKDIQFFCKVMIVTSFVFGFVIANCYVPSESMSPTLEEGQRFVGSRIAYQFNDVKRGDIVAFRFTGNERVKYLKRVIGLPGETIIVKDGDLYIDKIKYNEPYVTEKMNKDSGPFYVPKKGDVVTIQNPEYDNDGNIIKANCYINNNYVGFVGNSESDNSCELNTVDFLNKYCTEKDGEYVIKEDTYFMMGDNRNVSYDSRYWNNHYLKKSKIIAKYLFAYL